MPSKKKSKPASNSLPAKPVKAKDASSVKGGGVILKGKTDQHNQTLRRSSGR